MAMGLWVPSRGRSIDSSSMKDLDSSSIWIGYVLSRGKEGHCSRMWCLWQTRPPRTCISWRRRWEKSRKSGYKDQSPISALVHGLRLIKVILSGGGDQGDLGERFSHPKLRRTPENLDQTMEESWLDEIQRKLKEEIPETSKVNRTLFLRVGLWKSTRVELGRRNKRKIMVY
jgi:hypothetical protein